MTAEQAVAFLQALAVKQIKVKGNGWVEGSCPLAPWLHEHHQDQTPSFGIKIIPGQRSFFKCFACRAGSVEELVYTLEQYCKGDGQHRDFKMAHLLLEDEQKVLPLPEYGESQDTQVFEEWPEYWRESFSPVEFISEATDYLLHRRQNPADMATLKSCDVRWDSSKKMIVALYRNVYGKLAGARGRSALPNTQFKHFDYRWNGHSNAKLCWYNEPCLNLPGPVVAVEGQFDCWRVLQGGFKKVVANLTAKPSWEKMVKLSESGTVIQIPDRDEAGRQSVDVYGNFCAALGLNHKVLELGEGVKDPDDCHPAYLRDIIEELL